MTGFSITRVKKILKEKVRKLRPVSHTVTRGRARCGFAGGRHVGWVRAALADDIRPYVGAVRMRPGMAMSSVRTARVVEDCIAQ